MSKHQCDYCCWYWSGRCDCPSVMRYSACESAKRKKHEADRLNNNEQSKDN